MLKSEFNKGVKFLKKDKYFASIIKNNKIPLFPKENEYFQSLIKDKWGGNNYGTVKNYGTPTTPVTSQ